MENMVAANVLLYLDPAKQSWAKVSLIISLVVILNEKPGFL